MNSKTLAIVTSVSLAVMIAISGGTSSFIMNNANAQMTGNMPGDMMRQGRGMMNGNQSMMGMGPGMMDGNQSMMTQMIEADRNITGSINLFSTISDAIESKIQTSLSQAASTAEGAVGNNSHAVAAHIGEANGYLVYTVWVLGPDMKVNRVLVDPADGQVLLNRPVSMQHMMGMGMGMMDPGMGMMNSGMGHGMGMNSEMKDRGMEMMGPGMMW